MMRKVVLYTLMSLDGAVDDPGRYFPETADRLGPPGFDDELIRLETGMIERQDTVLLGRNMYDEWSRYWPTSNEQPFANFINRVEKVVVTSTPLENQWTNATAAIGTTLSETIRELTTRPGEDIGIHGSIRLAQSALREGLVDEINLAVGRVLDPSGRRLFDKGVLDDLRTLELIRATPTPSGSLWLSYRVNR